MKSFLLEAIDGCNPLGFLAALGALRLAELRWPEAGVRLGWERAGKWVPRLCGLPAGDEKELCRELLGAAAAPMEALAELGENITVSQGQFACFAARAMESAKQTDRRAADFAAAFGSEACLDEKQDRIRHTQLCFITGSGHQDFLGTMTSLLHSVREDHLEEALFGGWRMGNRGLSLRWDPEDAREYALRWNNPGPEGAWTTWGANRLAVEAIPFFPTQPGKRLKTTGFERREKVDEFTWPIWTPAVGCDEVRSLLAWQELQKSAPKRELLQATGVVEAFRAARVRIPPKGANFKVSFRPARAI